ncbi:MAG: hypothetical protein LBQ33_07050 [Oscillospiraceae bacterium]|jgi:hypothetical protein|nr:hypothetical protein [Oscillospiraceae bacterium]
MTALEWLRQGRLRKEQREIARLRKAWWESASEFPAQDEGGSFDVLGSYTGTPFPAAEDLTPEQDADDL